MAHMDEARFKVIDGDAVPRRSKAGKIETWECRTCERDTGIATSTIMQVVGTPKFEGPDLKVSLGSKYWVCAYCLGRGKVTRVT